MKKLKETENWFYSAAAMKEARSVWIKILQQPKRNHLLHSVVGGGVKILGKFKCLSPFEDKDKIWRVRSRKKDLIPFTCDNKPALILSNNCHYTKLLFEKGHRKSNLGAVSTVTKFCMNGFWTPQAIRRAKKVRSEFVICRLLDKQPMNQ